MPRHAAQAAAPARHRGASQACTCIPGCLAKVCLLPAGHAIAGYRREQESAPPDAAARCSASHILCWHGKPCGNRAVANSNGGPSPGVPVIKHALRRGTQLEHRLHREDRVKATQRLRTQQHAVGAVQHRICNVGGLCVWGCVSVKRGRGWMGWVGGCGWVGGVGGGGRWAPENGTQQQRQRADDAS